MRSGGSPPSHDETVKAPGQHEAPGTRPGATRGSVGQRVTLPALRQPVHTLSRLRVPLTVARTRWMLGSKRRLVIFFDHGRLLPKPGFLAQMSQTAATGLAPGWESGSGARAQRATGTRYPTYRRADESARPPTTLAAARACRA